MLRVRWEGFQVLCKWEGRCTMGGRKDQQYFQQPDTTQPEFSSDWNFHWMHIFIYIPYLSNLYCHGERPIDEKNDSNAEWKQVRIWI